MKHKLLCQVIFMCVVVAGWACAVHAATVPLMFNYQGQLKDANNRAVKEGIYTVTFRIYDAPSGGHLIWGRSQVIQVEDGGFFNALIGEGGNELNMEEPQYSNLADVFRGESRGMRWLEIQVSGAKPFSRRQQLTAMPQAFLAANASRSTGDFNVGGTMTVGSNATVSGDVVVDQYAVLEGPLKVMGNASLSNALLTDVTAEFHGDAYLKGPVTMSHNLNQQGAPTFKQRVSVGGTLSVTKPLTWFGPMTQLRDDWSGTGSYTPTNDGFYVCNFFFDKDSKDEDTYDSTITTQSKVFHFKTKWYCKLADHKTHYHQIFMLPAKSGQKIDFDINTSTHELDLYWRPMYK